MEATPNPPGGDDILLEIDGLKLVFRTYSGTVQVLDSVHLRIRQGTLFGLAGETGCGKSVIAYSIIRLLPALAEITAGRIMYKGENLLDKSEADIHRHIRGREIALVLQNPQNTLNPSVRIGNQMSEALQTHGYFAKGRYSRREAKKQALDMLRKVKINDPEYRLAQFPHELSGGLQQRVNTAIALLCRPSLLIADEFTTNLDVTTQAEVMRVVCELQHEMGMSILLISHDLALLSRYCQDIGIVYAGQIVERGSTREVFRDPSHPYTRGLMNCIPSIDRLESQLNVIPGRVPKLIDPPAGCRFHTRCPHKIPGRCDRTLPAETRLSESHSVWCHLF